MRNISYSKGNWTIYDSTNSPFASTTSIINGEADRNSTVWISYQRDTILSFSNYSWSANAVSDIASQAKVEKSTKSRDIASDSSFWTCFDSCIIRHEDDNTWTKFNYKELLPTGTVEVSIKAGTNNDFWLFCTVPTIGLGHLTDSKWTFYPMPNYEGVITRNLSLTRIDKSNRAWIYSDPGPICFDGKEFKLWSIKENHFPGSIYLGRTQNAFGEFWTTVKDGSELDRYCPISFNGERWKIHTPENSRLIDNNIGSVISLPNKTHWFATSLGISRLDSLKNWEIWNDTNCTINARSITSMVRDSTGNVWAGSNSWNSKTLAKYDGKVWSTLSCRTADLPSSSIYDMDVDGKGHLWIAHDSGVTMYDGRSWKSWYRTDSLPANLTGIACGKNLVWVSSANRATSFDGNKWKPFTKSNSLIPAENLQDVAVDRAENPWFVSKEIGLFTYNSGLFSACDPKVPDTMVGSISLVKIDASNKIWIGTASSGVAKFDGTTWKIYDTTNSKLPSNKVTSIAFDIDGSKWFGTYGGGVAHLIDDDTVTAIKPTDISMKRSMVLSSENSKLHFSLVERSSVLLQIFDLRGRLVLNRDLGECESGDHWLPIATIAGGVYVARMSSPNGAVQAKVMI